jgi:hypothetical protein
MLVTLCTKNIAMQAYRVEVKIEESGLLTLSDLPLQAGEEVEVIILVQSPGVRPKNPYPLRSLPITYLNPTELVAQSDWVATQ